MGLIFGISACSDPLIQAPIESQETKPSNIAAKPSSVSATEQKTLKNNAAMTVTEISKVIDSSEYHDYIHKYEEFVGTDQAENELENSLTFEKDTLAIWEKLEPYVLFDVESQTTADYMKQSFESEPSQETKDVVYKSAVLYDLSFLFDNLGGNREFIDNIAEVDETGKYKLVDGGFLIKNKEGHILRTITLPLHFELTGKALNVNDLLAATLVGPTPSEMKAVIHNDVIMAVKTLEGELVAFEKTGKKLKDFDLQKAESKISKNDHVKIDVKLDSRAGSYTVIGSGDGVDIPNGTIEFDRKSGEVVDKMDIGTIGSLHKLSTINDEIHAARFQDYQDVIEYLPELQRISISEDLKTAKPNEKESTIDVTVDGKGYKVAIGNSEGHSH